MPVLTPFSAWAPKPDLVGSAATAAKQVLDSQRLASEIAMHRDTLRQQAQLAFANHQIEMMKLDAAQKAQEADNQIKLQTLETNKSMDILKLGLMERDVKSKEAANAFKLTQSTADLARNKEYRDRFQGYLSSGKTPEEAARLAMLEVLPPAMKGMPANVLPRQDGMSSGIPPLTPVDMGDGRTAYRTGPNSFSIRDPVKPPAESTVMMQTSVYPVQYTKVPLSQVKDIYDGMEDSLKANKANKAAVRRAGLYGAKSGGGGLSYEDYLRRRGGTNNDAGAEDEDETQTPPPAPASPRSWGSTPAPLWPLRLVTGL